jgi:hypothetical protein
VFEKSVVRRIFEPKREEIRGGTEENCMTRSLIFVLFARHY